MVVSRVLSVGPVWRFVCKLEKKFFVQSFLDGAVLNKVRPKFLKVRKKLCCKSPACHSHVTGWRNVKKINSWCQMVSRPWVQTSFQQLLLWLFLSGHKDCTTQSLRGKHHLHSLLWLLAGLETEQPKLGVISISFQLRSLKSQERMPKQLQGVQVAHLIEPGGHRWNR